VGNWEIARPDLNPNHQLSITILARCYWVLRFLTADIRMGIKISMGIKVGNWEIARPDLNPNHQLSITSHAHCYWVLRFLTAEIRMGIKINMG